MSSSGSSAENEDVHPAVVVVVKEGATAAHLFDDVGHSFGDAVVHGGREAALSRATSVNVENGLTGAVG